MRPLHGTDILSLSLFASKSFVRQTSAFARHSVAPISSPALKQVHSVHGLKSFASSAAINTEGKTKRMTIFETKSSCVDAGSDGTSNFKTFSSVKEARAYVAQSVLDGSVSISVARCGELACQHDSFRATLDDTKVLSWAAFKEAKFSKKRSKKKGGGCHSNDSSSSSSSSKETSTGTNMSRFHTTQIVMALTDSILYPEGGGQPCDTGRLIIETSSPDVSIDSIELVVSESNGVNQLCLLTCKVPLDVAWETVVDALAAENTSVKQKLDWDRRFDLMTQHSAQHLISAVALGQFDMSTHSFSLSTTSQISYVDLIVDSDVDTDVHRSTIGKVEQIVNENIRLDLPMRPRYVEKAELEAGGIRSRLLPDGITGKIRLVEIGDGSNMVDQNTCGGTHVPSLSQLQMIKFFRLDRQKSNVVRVYFAAGPRLMSVLSNSYERQANLTTMLSCMEDETVNRVSALMDDKREKDKEIQRLNERLCEHQAKNIVQMLKTNDMVATFDVGESEMAYKTTLASKVAEQLEDMGGALLLLIGGGDGDEGSFLLIGEVVLVDISGKAVAEALGGRGGGRNGKFQGKGNKIRSARDEALQIMLNAKK